MPEFVHIHPRSLDLPFPVITSLIMYLCNRAILGDLSWRKAVLLQQAINS